MAKCTEKCVLRPSTDADLAFFEYTGLGSPDATDRCVCGYHRVAHDPEEMAKRVPGNRTTVVQDGKCTGFRARGPAQYDRYYCGCRGWD